MISAAPSKLMVTSKWFGAFPIYILTEQWIKNALSAAYLEAQRIATNLTQAARHVILNGIYNNENQVVFSLKRLIVVRIRP